jgi:hypothetical protein
MIEITCLHCHKDYENLKLMLGVVLESHKKGYSTITEPIAKKIEELLK